jgi:putative SOS response-associated peptidase YedK
LQLEYGSQHPINMCGRYRLTRKKEILAEHFGIEPPDNWQPRYNVAPTQDVPVIRQHPGEPRRLASTMRWGLIPFWSKDPSVGFKMINARSEGIADKPAFKEALRKRRCLIPADGFYEWQKSGGKKRPFCFTLADESPFAFAGLWERWKDSEGKLVETCSIITTTPNRLTEDVHDRMPVILHPEDYDLWLDPGFQKTEDLCALLKPYEPEAMKRYEVSPRVGSVQFDDPECAAPLEPSTLFPM